MKRKTKFFLIVLSCLLLLQAGGLILIQHLPFRVASFAFKKIGSEAVICENAREEWVMNLYDTLRPNLWEVKDELHELKCEAAPPISIPIPLPEAIQDEEFDFIHSSFQSSQLELEEPSRIFEEEDLMEKCLDFTSRGDVQDAHPESEHFYTNIEYIQRRLHPGFVFKVTLIPKQQVPFKKIRGNYYFLIDRSNSIARGRYLHNKKAVSDSLSLLKEGDKFNIVIFDDRVTRFSNEALLWTEETCREAKHFLEQEGHGGYFAVTDIYSSIGKILPQDVNANESHTAILLSDGDTYLTLEKQRKLIGGWTAKNAGKIALFCIASGSGNNLPMLELISQFNKGELLYVSKHDQVEEKLKQLILSLQHPIGKKIVATAVACDDEQVIYLQPKQSRLPEFYKNRSYTVFGFTNRLSDFRLFLQGNYDDRPFDINKVVSFKEARRGTLFLEREWAELVASEHYERFLNDGKMAHLEAAKELLAPFHVTVPFLEKNP